MEEPGRISKDLVIDDGFPQVSLSRQTPKKKGLTIRRMMILIAIVAGAIWIIPPAYIIFDFMIGGPYLSTFSLIYQNIAIDASLLGRPENDVVPVLGTPTGIRVYDQNSGRKAYLYAPVYYFPLGAVYIQCNNGIVVAIEPWDD